MREKMTRRTIQMLTGTFILVGAMSAVAQGPASEVLKDLEEYNGRVKSIKSDIRMAKVNNQLKLSDIQNGKLYYVPDEGRQFFLRIEWKDPEELLVVAKGKFVLYRPRLKQALIGEVGNSKNGGEANILSFLSMTRKEVQAEFDVVWVGRVSVQNTAATHLRLEPKKRQGIKTAEIWIDNDGRLVRAKVTELNNDETVLGLSNLVEDQRLSGSLFSIALPKDVKKIRV